MNGHEQSGPNWKYALHLQATRLMQVLLSFFVWKFQHCCSQKSGEVVLSYYPSPSVLWHILVKAYLKL